MMEVMNILNSICDFDFASFYGWGGDGRGSGAGRGPGADLACADSGAGDSADYSGSNRTFMGLDYARRGGDPDLTGYKWKKP